MAEPQNDGQTPQRHETTDPRNPPNSVANATVRRLALRSYLGPLVALFIVIGLGLMYWANRGPIYDGVEDGRVGTTGEAGLDTVGERGGGDAPGGFDPAPRPDSTRDELESRGVSTETDLRQINEIDQTTLGRRVEISGATVVAVQSAMLFSIEKDNATAVVSAPTGGPAVRDGQTVTVSGIVEPGQNGARIRATRVSVD